MRIRVPGRGLFTALVVLAACSQSPDQRVRVGGDAAQRLLDGGAKLVEDYGAFKVVQADPSAVAALAPGEATVLDGRILLNAGAFDPEAIRTLAVRNLAIPAKGRTLSLVQFAGPVRPAWHDALLATGLRVVTYVPNDAYLVYGDAAALTALSSMTKSSPFVRWTGAYLDADKLDPSARTLDTGAWSVQLVEDAEANATTLFTVALLEKKVTRVSTELGYVNLVVHCTAAEAASLAARPEVVSIQPWVEPTKNDERQAMILAGHIAGNLPSEPGYFAWLGSKGFTQAQFTASGFGVDVTDSGIDNGSTTPNHSGLYAGGSVASVSRVAYNRLEGTPNTGSTIQGCDGHGTLNAHIVGGYPSLGDAVHADAAGYRYGMGIAPFVKVGSSVIFDPGTFTFPDFEDLQSRAWANGMRISTNSWGASTNLYTTDSQRYDALVRDAAPAASAVPVAGNQEMTIVFAAGNDGPGTNTVGTPGTAKNVITVGGTEGVQPLGAADGCGVTDVDADSMNDIAFFSSRGPTSDGRKKPDLVAPATHISGGVAQAAGQRADPPAAATGAALSCFDATGVCGGAGTNHFFPATQQWYTASSGTSHSTPAAAGAAALVRQWFLNHGSNAPSPAMTKAYLMNASRYLIGSGANDTLPSNSQGMGLLDLGMGFDDVGRLLVDQDPAHLFTATGQTFTFDGSIASAGAPLRVTLAWTDAPGSTTGSAWKNNLDLTVTVGGSTYLGNVFLGANSVTGGAADLRNNVESVFLPAGLTGPFTVTVTAASINSDGVPGNASTLDQDFALVVYGACDAPPPGIPDGVTAAATADNRVEVSWNENGSTEYRVYRSTTPGGPYTRIGSAAAPPFVDTTVSGGRIYHYVVRTAACAESADSNEASVVATGACTLPPTFAGLTSAVSNGTATCGNTISWAAATPTCGGTVTYSVHRSTVADFTPGPANRIATGLTGTSFLDDLNLQDGTTYHYVVRATEVAASTSTDDNTVAGAVAARGATTLAFFDDFDANRPASAASYWIASGTAGLVNLTNGCRYQSPTWAYRLGGAANAICGGTYPNNASTTLSLGGNGTVAGINGFQIGAGATLSFHRWHGLENNWDGAWLVYSTTSAGGPWTYVGDALSTSAPYIATGGYNGTASSAGGTRVWTGSSGEPNGALPEVTVNLDALAGQTAWFAWRFTTDSSVTYEGFYLDDVQVSSFGACTTNVPPPGPAASFTLSLPATTGAGAAATVTATAVDAVGLVATDYVGPATVTSSDPQAVLPSPITFASGVATTTVELRTLGTQTVTLTDPANPDLTASGGTSVLPGAPAALAFGLQPSNVVAGVAIAPGVTVRIVDAFGNLTSSTDAVTLALGANPGGDTLAGTLTVSAVAGVATFPDLVLDRAAEGYTLTATSGSLSAATSAAFAVAPAAATHLELVQDASTTVAGDAIAPAPAVALRDVFGNLATDSTATVTVALAANPSGGTLAGTLSVPAVGGIATFSDLWLDKVGDGYQLAAASGSLTGATGTGFAITHAAADHLAFVQQPTDIVAGDPLSPAVSVEVLDRFANLATGYVGNVSLGLAVNPTATILAGTSTETVVAGVAVFSDVSVQVAGTYYSLSATSGLLSGAVSRSFNVSPGAVAHLVFATQPAGSVAGARVAGLPSVHLVDAYGNRRPEATDAVTVALGANPGGDTLAGTLTVNAVAGSATFTDLVLDRAADGYALVATAGGHVAESAGFDVHPAPPAALEFVAAPGTTPAGAPLAPAPVVRVRDAFGNTVTSSSATVALAIDTNPAAGTLSGATSVAATGGAASFPGLSVDAMGGGYTLTATSAGLTSASCAPFGIGAGTPATLAFVTQPVSVQAGAPLPSITVEIRDAWGNRTAATSEVILGFATAPGSATLSGSRRVTTVDGRATFTDLSVDKAGTGYALSAAVAGLPGTVSDAFDVSAGAVAQLLFATQPTGSVAGAPLAGPPSVRLLDAYGNPTSAADAVIIALGANPGGDALGGTLTVNAVAGVATFTNVVLDQAASGYTLVASSGSASATSAAFAVAPAAPSALEFVMAPGATLAGAPLAPAPVVRVRDAFGNTVASSSATVTLALGTNPASGSLSGATSVAASGGVATFPGLSIGAVGAGYTLTATSAGLASTSCAPFSIGAGSPATLAFVTQPASVQAGAPLPAITVEIRDAWGNRTAATSEVILGFATAPGSATLSGSRRVSAVGGRATFADLSVDKAGTGYALSAIVAGLPATVSAAFDVTAGAVAQLLFATQPTGSVAGAPLAGPPSVRLLDAYGNATSATDAVTVALGANPGGDALGGTLIVNAVAGVATFADLVLDQAASGYTLVASSGSASATSATFAVAPAAPSALEFVAAPVTTPAGAALAPAPVVRVRDAFGNTVASSSATVTLALGTNPASGALSGATSVAATGGVATFPGLSIGAVGAGYTLTASADGLTTATCAAFDVGTGAPATLAFIAQPATIQAGAPLPSVTVEIRDAWGNRTAATSEVILGLATGPGSATLTGSRRVSAVDGRATFADLSVDTAGTGYALSAAVAGLPGTVSDAFDVTPLPAEADKGGCGCGGGSVGELGLLLGLAGLWRAAIAPRRRRAA